MENLRECQKLVDIIYLRTKNQLKLNNVQREADLPSLDNNFCIIALASGMEPFVKRKETLKFTNLCVKLEIRLTKFGEFKTRDDVYFLLPNT